MAGSGLVVGGDFGTRDRVEGIGSGHERGVGLMAGEDEAMSFDGWWGWREREKESDGLEKGKQILGRKTEVKS